MASSNVVMVRMNKELAQRFDLLRQEFAGLPPSTIARFIVTATLAMPLEQQIEIIDSQVRRPGSALPKKSQRKQLGVNSRRL